MKASCVLIFMLFIYGGASAQSWLPSFMRDTVDTKYIDNLSRRLTVRMILTTKALNFSLRDRDMSAPIIRYAPNSVSNFGIGAFYRNLGGELSVKVLRNQVERNARYGNTESFDIQFNGYGPQISTDLIYQSYRGFYMTDPALALADWDQTKAYPQRPDLHMHNMGLNLYYIFNHLKFSYQAAFIQTKRQKKDAGSFLVMTSLWHLRLNSDSTLIPALVRPEFGDNTEFEQGRFYTLAFMPGYAYSKVHKRLYITGSLCAGPGFQYRNYVLQEQMGNSFGLEPRMNVRFSAGYNGVNFMTGVSAVVDRVFNNFESLHLRTNTNNLKLFMGYRF